MKIIEGFEKARAVLSRQSSGDVPGGDEREQTVRQIIEDVRRRGDAALLDYTERFDGVRPASLEVDKEEIAAAAKKLDKELYASLKLAAERVRAFHQAQKESVWHEASLKGLKQLVRPLRRVGVYVPGGTAAYPSTVLMTAIPAKVAGVSEIVMATPPQKDGSIPLATLAAAKIAGVDRVFRVGGAQAIAALAYGTETVPAVDKICGPGNIYVMLAKKQVYGAVAIDALQGPSDVLVIADDETDPACCAGELLAQAEHDALAEAMMVTTSRQMADRVAEELEKQLAALPRRDIAAASLEKGIIAVVANLDEAIELANLYAPEHLCLMVADAMSYLDKITNAGCVFAGRGATVALGDYVAGPSHALPTGGTARFSSPLNVGDFIKFISVVDTGEVGVKEIGDAASVIARAEGLDAHARALEMRMKNKEQDNAG